MGHRLSETFHDSMILLKYVDHNMRRWQLCCSAQVCRLQNKSTLCRTLSEQTAELTLFFSAAQRTSLLRLLVWHCMAGKEMGRVRDGHSRKAGFKFVAQAFQLPKYPKCYCLFAVFWHARVDHLLSGEVWGWVIIVHQNGMVTAKKSPRLHVPSSGI
jgi:hypothetical protein